MIRRLTSLRLENYRSIRGRHTINLDAPVVLIHGANGSGKTSLLSALEMGLTGTAVAMRRTDPNYTSYLVHKGADEAIIDVRCRHDSFDTPETQLTIQSGAVDGQPALPEHFRRLYTERCFLAQATLSRLLDIYEQKSAKADDALTRFVRDLMGLDQFQSLLAGLHHTRHVTRLRNAVPAYAEVEQELARLQRELGSADADLAAERDELTQMREALQTQLEPLGLSDAPTEVRANALSTERDEARATSLRSFSREIDSALAQWTELSGSADLERLRTAEEAAETLEHDLEAWRFENQESVVRALTLASGAKDAPSFGEDADCGEEVEMAFRRLQVESSRIDARLKADKEVDTGLSEAREASEKAAGRITRLDSRLTVLSAESGALARALSEIEPFVKTEVCPVCHRDFSETDGLPLHAHLTEHVSTLAVAAEDLREATTQSQAEVRAKEAAGARISDLEKRKRSNDVRAEDEKRLTAIGEARVALEAVSTVAGAGSQLLARRRQTSAELSKVRRDARTFDGLRESIVDYPTRLDLQASTEAEGVGEILDRCRKAVSEQIEQLDNQIGAKSTARQTLDRISAQSERVERLRAKRVRLKEAQENMQGAFDRSNATRDEAKKLAGFVEEVRTRIVSRVFNDQLNATWRDLFVRLAPDEQFVPAFSIPEEGSRTLEVKLETRLRDGTRSGHPKSILSAGNLNTAALTLFLSLHLSVEPLLPWLVIDDPVQSMDEIHTAQFAALVRTLSRQGGRQVIIAVHERSLFDYLALELAPASPDDRLITVQLFKEAGKDTEIKPHTKIWDPVLIYSPSEAQSA